MTFRIALLLVTREVLFVATTLNRFEFMLKLVNGTVKLSLVAPTTATSFEYHWNPAAPAAMKLKVADWPSETVTFAGWRVITIGPFANELSSAETRTAKQ